MHVHTCYINWTAFTCVVCGGEGVVAVTALDRVSISLCCRLGGTGREGREGRAGGGQVWIDTELRLLLNELEQRNCNCDDLQLVELKFSLTHMFPLV